MYGGWVSFHLSSQLRLAGLQQSLYSLRLLAVSLLIFIIVIIIIIIIFGFYFLRRLLCVTLAVLELPL